MPISTRAKIFILMGVSATGKSTLGKALAQATGGTFIDGDDYHSDANRKKMASRIPLTDEDRRPWLNTLANIAAERAALHTPTFIACSALKKSYRDRLTSRNGDLQFLHLHADPELLRQRITTRFKEDPDAMPPELLDSQLNDLEPEPDAFLLDVSLPVTTLLTQFLDKYPLLKKNHS